MGQVQYTYETHQQEGSSLTTVHSQNRLATRYPVPRVALDAVVNALCSGIKLTLSPSILPFTHAVVGAVADRAESFTRKYSV